MLNVFGTKKITSNIIPSVMRYIDLLSRGFIEVYLSLFMSITVNKYYICNIIDLNENPNASLIPEQVL